MLVRLLRLLLISSLLSAPAWALSNSGIQAPLTVAGVSATDCPAAVAASGPTTNGGTNGKAVALQLPSWASSADIDISGTFVATWALLSSTDNTTYRNAVGLSATNYFIIQSAGTPSTFSTAPVSGRYICIVLTAYTSGTAVVTIEPRSTPLYTYTMLSTGAAGGGTLTAGTASGNAQGALSTSSVGLMTVAAADKTIVNEAAVSTAATATIAAGGATVRHIATSCSASISTVAAQPDIIVRLTDGAGGAGTILWSCRLTCAISTVCQCQSPPINILGTANTGMSCVTSAAPAAGNFATATLTYHDAG